MRRMPIGFRKFAEKCIPEWFTEPHAEAQLAAMRRGAVAALRGGLHAVAMEPGDGKTTLAMAAVLWVTFEGLRKYPLLLTKDAPETRRARTVIAEARLRETHGRVQPFFEDEQVLSIWEDFAGLSRPVPCLSRPGSSSGGLLKLHRPDLIVIDDPDQALMRETGQFSYAGLDEILTKTIPAMLGPGRGPAALLLGSPSLVARVAGKGWEVD
jgi:hypothetical protein